MNDLFGNPLPVDQPKQDDDWNIKVEDGTDTWFTPPEILRVLGRFELDPCTIANPPWGTAAKHYDRGDDGLKKQWAGRVWLNPPYSQLKAWLARMAGHGHRAHIRPDGNRSLPRFRISILLLAAVHPGPIEFLHARRHPGQIQRGRSERADQLQRRRSQGPC